MLADESKQGKEAPPLTRVVTKSVMSPLNLAVGGDFPGPIDATTPFPSRMYVDYVRVYK